MTPKEHIINVAEDLFFRKGFHLTTIRDIASEADINLSMINYHFKSKEGLYLRLFDKLDSLLIVLQNQVQENAHNSQLLRDFIMKTWYVASLHPKIVYLFFVEELQPSTDKIKTKVKNIQKFHFKFFLKIASKGKTFGENEGRLLYASIFGSIKEFFKLFFINQQKEFGDHFIEKEFSDQIAILLDKTFEVWNC